MGRSESRQKTETIGVRCTPEEKAALKARADAFGISVGALCRDTIFGAKPKSKTDQNAIDELALTRADLGRLGGLLKGWLAGVFEEVGTPTVDTMPHCPGAMSAPSWRCWLAWRAWALLRCASPS